MADRHIETFDNWGAMRARFRWRIPENFNIAHVCADRHARRIPDEEAIVHLEADGRTEIWTFRMLAEKSDRFAVSLRALGIEKGDRVGILMSQHPIALTAHLAAMKLGAVSLPLFTAFGTEALKFRLADSGAKAVITDGGQIDKLMSVADTLDELTHVICSTERSGVLSWDSLISKAHGNLPPVETAADDPAMLIYTSGTTGAPKGVLHAHRFLIGHLPSIETTHEGFPQPRDRGWTPADWAWIGGLMDMAMPCLYYGVPQVSHRMTGFDPGAAVHLISKHQLRNLFMPPTALKMMRAADVSLPSRLRSVSSGGEALGAEMLDWGKEVLGCPIHEIYGQTECNLSIAHTSTTMQARPGTMGQAVPGFDVAVFNHKDQPVASGEVGEIRVRSPNPVVFLEYWNQPQATEEKFSNGWLRTGDLGAQDEDGYFTFHGRTDDLIMSAGYRIGPSEIESCLMSDPEVVLAAAIGIPHETRGEAVCAVVVPRDGGSPELESRLIDMVRNSLGPHVVPSRVEFTEEMPLTATGKIMRRKLRERFS